MVCRSSQGFVLTEFVKRNPDNQGTVVGTRMDAVVTGLAGIGTITDTGLVDLGTRLDTVEAKMDEIDNRKGAGETNTADEGTPDVHIRQTEWNNFIPT